MLHHPSGEQCGSPAMPGGPTSLQRCVRAGPERLTAAADDHLHHGAGRVCRWAERHQCDRDARESHADQSADAAASADRNAPAHAGCAHADTCSVPQPNACADDHSIPHTVALPVALAVLLWAHLDASPNQHGASTFEYASAAYEYFCATHSYVRAANFGSSHGYVGASDQSASTDRYVRTAHEYAVSGDRHIRSPGYAALANGHTGAASHQ